MGGESQHQQVRRIITRTLERSGEVTIEVEDDYGSESMIAVRYTATNPDLDLSMFVKKGAGLGDRIRVSFLDDGTSTDPILSSAIDLPMDGKNTKDNDPAQGIYSMIRAATEGDYTFYTCAHAAGEKGMGTRAQGDGVHRLNLLGAVEDCRAALGTLNTWWNLKA